MTTMPTLTEEYPTTTTKKKLFCSLYYNSKEGGKGRGRKVQRRTKNKKTKTNNKKKRANIPNTLHNLLLAKQQWRPAG